ncbi:hypothetical protein GCM10007067_06770 [Lysobacter bugurensis]|uniref:VCBS repeat-containing protein n=1 Tax=Cognatilysobacter bugurensis TaxID=543356 RepID=A0A918SV11_9GAMM|nr:hypothetical protein GCM10007067_06770 [Lysobacter bugurensis]
MGAEVNAVAVGDVTGDGRDDVVAVTSYSWSANENTSRVFVLEQQPDGSLLINGKYPFGNSTAYRVGITLGDMNRDGVRDIVVGHSTGISVLTVNSAGGFTTAVYSAPQASDVVGVLDIDLDGNMDVIGQSWSSGAYLFFGNGAGGIARSQSFPTNAVGYNDLKVGDVTGDGFPDVLISSGQGSRNFWVYPHDRKGGLGLARTYTTSSTGWSPYAVAIGDLNHDGLNDVALPEPKNSPAQIWTYYQSGAGELHQGASLQSYDIPSASISTDLNRDGRDDLVVLHGGWSNVGFYMQGPNGLQPERLFAAPVSSHPNPQGLGAGDVNGDGCSDVAYANSNQGVVLLYGKNCGLPKPRDDVDGDGKSDLLWRDDAKQNFALWNMVGANVVGSAGYSVGAAWNVVAKGDFNGDRRLDIVWSDGASMQMWKTSSSGYVGASMGPFPSGYRVVATGDVDGDGRDDMVWRDNANTVLALWGMNGERIVSSSAYGLPSSWRVIGAGDLTGERRLDLVVASDRVLELWSGSAGLSFTRSEMGGYPVGWVLAGAGDVSGDGYADLLWRHADGGHFVVWSMAGPLRMAGTGYSVGSAWRVAHVGDQTGDGLTDVVWTDGTAMQLWTSNGASFSGANMPRYPAGWALLRE